MAESRERMLEELRKTKAKWFDTHPTFSERIAAVADFPDAAAPSPGGTELAIELITDHPAVEAELTDILTAHVHRMSSDGEDAT
jgi:hypothetical protein